MNIHQVKTIGFFFNTAEDTERLVHTMWDTARGTHQVVHKVSHGTHIHTYTLSQEYSTLRDTLCARVSPRTTCVTTKRPCAHRICQTFPPNTCALLRAAPCTYIPLRSGLEGGAEGDGGQRLRLAAGEHPRPVNRRQHVHLKNQINFQENSKPNKEGGGGGGVHTYICKKIPTRQERRQKAAQQPQGRTAPER